ncbi:hypothetical protein ACOSQ4_002890 [Xanthoceras sorbifolium]
MLEVAGGWEEHEFFKAYNYDLASAIRTDGNGWTADRLRDSWGCHLYLWSLALPLLDHTVLRNGRNKQECCWRNNTEA